jgi:hypothetical protein
MTPAEMRDVVCAGCGGAEPGLAGVVHCRGGGIGPAFCGRAAFRISVISEPASCEGGPAPNELSPATGGAISRLTLFRTPRCAEREGREIAVGENREVASPGSSRRELVVGVDIRWEGSS